ncbi:DUF4863 family protein [Achromobacter sp. GG226]|uniref:DUF4863 family protein n=1 Tax=Verticiella alkaliphila TaxID=2779529 RepID=UPI001C0BF1A8|nr:DUF4863 family protein [Verticiella sp. GG226]MBU4612855.1 DUF4863 family protein [Verticiella sp. GG226]
MTTQFNSLVQTMTRQLAGRPLDADLQTWLNATYGAESDWFRDMQEACTTGIAEGWMCKHEAGGIRYGRVIKPSPETDGFSVDVVDMQDIAGPHHAHPTGEIDLVMPLTPDAQFDGTPAGWKVYPPGSAHSPTVRQGRALVMYFLPEGRIEFTRA